MAKIIAIVFPLFFFQLSANAQQFMVKGMVKDSASHESLIGVNIVLVNQDNKDKKYYATTDLEGGFQFLNIPTGSYRFTATYVGYNIYTGSISFKNGPIQLGNLYLSPSVQMMEGVVIRAKAGQSVMLADTTQFNAGAFKTAPDASGQDLVEKLPGITIQSGNLQAQGETVQQVLVDGKPFFGNDVKAALQSLPAEVIANIQVFDKKSDKAELSGFDDGERQKTINIITKPNRKKGQFGKTSLGYGTNNKYQAAASVNFFSDDRRITVTGLSNNINTVSYSADPNSQGDSRTQDGIITTNSIGVNFSDEWGEKIEISASYLFSHSKNEDNATIFRDYVLPSDSGQVYTEDNYSNRKNMDHRFNMRFEYNIDTNNRILVRPRITFNKDENYSYFIGGTITDNGPLNQTENTTRSDHYNYDFENEMYYSHRFQKGGRTLTIGLNTGYYTIEDDAKRLANNVYYEAEDSVQVINQHTDLERKGFSWDAEFSYTEPLGKNGQVELEYEIEDRLNDSDKLTYNVYEDEQPIYSVLDTALSNTFKSEYLVHQAELGYQYATKKLRLQVEGEYQHAILQNDQEFPAPLDLRRTFGSWMPTVRFDYKFSSAKSIEIDYDTRTSEPTIEQLQDVIDNSNPLHLRTGNPNLDQSYANRIRVRYRGSNPDTDQSLFVYIASSFIKNSIANSSIIAEEPIELRDGIVLEQGSQLMRPINIDGYWDFRSYLTYGKPVNFIKSNINLSGSINYTKMPGMVNDKVSFVNSGDFMLGLSLSSNISEKVDFNISTRSRYNIVKNSLSHNLNDNSFNQTTRFSYDWIFWQGFVFRVDLNHQYNTGLAESFDNSFLLMNMSLGKKFLKNDLAEVSINVYDLLEQNNNVSRNVSELYIEDRKSTVLQRYFMLTLTYNIRHFSRGTSMSDFEDM